ncbi:hypothetical protein HMPREF0557_02543 [Listeria innocua ATCC 33091]|uniref:Uncharacterized protein n=1 Tax=Listeria innocua ATCC 33091 TaxID=1002366 RepID=A0AB72Z659_LISIO|nr:hypothetical protein HMPREF0557_02543 [Listeria innocua ATCC 33091]
MLQKQMYSSKHFCSTSVKSSFSKQINNHTVSFGIFKQIKL